MKKITIIVLILVLSQNLYAQVIGELSWKKKYGFEEGITQAIVFEGSSAVISDDNQFLLAFNSTLGTINTYSVDKETGAIGDLKFEKIVEKKGTWAASLISTYSGTKYIAISYADYGVLEIYVINKDGSIGDKTWETTSFEKGISIVIPMQEYVLLVKPNAGFAWVFKHKDGKLGEMIWQTNNWEKGIAAGVSTGISSAVLTHPNGKFWSVSCSTGEAVVKYTTDQYTKGITIIASNPLMTNFVFVANPDVGYEWGLKSKLTDVEVVTDIFNWEKGLTVQAFTMFKKDAYNIPHEGFLYVFKPEIGAVWVFKATRS